MDKGVVGVGRRGESGDGRDVGQMEFVELGVVGGKGVVGKDGVEAGAHDEQAKGKHGKVEVTVQVIDDAISPCASPNGTTTAAAAAAGSSK